MSDLMFAVRTLYSLVVSLLMIWYSLKLFVEFRRHTITLGKIFLKKEKVSRVFSSFSIALFLLLVFSITALSERTIMEDVGIYSVNISILFLLYALHSFYGVVRR